VQTSVQNSVSVKLKTAHKLHATCQILQSGIGHIAAYAANLGECRLF